MLRRPIELYASALIRYKRRRVKMSKKKCKMTRTSVSSRGCRQATARSVASCRRVNELPSVMSSTSLLPVVLLLLLLLLLLLVVVVANWCCSARASCVTYETQCCGVQPAQLCVCVCVWWCVVHVRPQGLPPCTNSSLTAATAQHPYAEPGICLAGHSPPFLVPLSFHPSFTHSRKIQLGSLQERNPRLKRIFTHFGLWKRISWQHFSHLCAMQTTVKCVLEVYGWGYG